MYAIRSYYGLPEGSIHKIASELELRDETVRNYFGGANFREGRSLGVHYEQGPDGGIVELDDTTILELAEKMVSESRQHNQV